MPGTIQKFLAVSTQKAADDLVTALEALPTEKRCWKPTESARSAMDQVAECAILNGSTADSITNRSGPTPEFMTKFVGMKESLAQDERAALSLLEENTARVIAVIQAVPAEDFDTEVPMPWGPMPLREICVYPFWNMTYHQGQIVYIASLLKD